IEDLNAVVFPIGHVDLALVLPDRMHGVKDTGFVSRVAQVAGVARLTPRLDQRAVSRVLVNAAVAVTVGNVDIAGAGDTHVGGMVEWASRALDAIQHRHSATRSERSGWLAGVPDVAGIGGVVAFAESKAVTTGLVELENHLWIAVDEVQRVVWCDTQAVGILEDAIAPGIEQLAGLIEDEIRVLGASERVHMVVG